MKAKTARIIIISGGSLIDLCECLLSLSETTYGPCETVVIDNSVTLGGSEAVESAPWGSGLPDGVHSSHREYGDLRSELALRFPEVEVIQPDWPLTFAAAANCGLWYAFEDGAQIAFLLNDDVTVHAEALSVLAAAERKAGPGIYAPEIWPYYGNGERRRYRFDWKKRLVVSEPADGRNGSNGTNGAAPGAPAYLRGGFRPADLRRRPPHTHQISGLHPIDYAEASAVLISRKAFKALGGFDEDFGFYFEDADLSVRARDAGFPVMEVSGAKVWHKGSATAGKGLSPFKAYWRARNAMRFAKKHRRHSSPKLNAAYHFGGFVLPQAVKAAVGALTGNLSDARTLAALAKGTWENVTCPH